MAQTTAPLAATTSSDSHRKGHTMRRIFGTDLEDRDTVHPAHCDPDDAFHRLAVRQSNVYKHDHPHDVA